MYMRFLLKPNIVLSSVIITLVFIAITLFIYSTTLGTVLADEDGHSHFRFGHITWERDYSSPPNTAKITFTAGFRRSGYVCRDPITNAILPCTGPGGLPGIGDVIWETIGGTGIQDFGDGTSTGTLHFEVFAFDSANDWILARALQPGTNNNYLLHTYPNVGPFTLYSFDCCRISAQRPPNAHLNNPDQLYRMETVIDFRTSASPISLLPPIVDCPRASVCSFTVAAVDPDASNPEAPRRIRWRIATPEEMGGVNLSQPPGAAIDPETGLYTWDTTNVPLGPEGYNTLYSTQVVIEDLDAGNNPLSKVILDFFIRIVELPGPSEDFIRIPTRWCALQGSPSVEDPSLAGFSSTDDVLRNRLRVLNERIYIPQAGIALVSGLRSGSYPVIQGPHLDGHFYNQSLGIDRDLAVNACRLAWRDQDPSVTGVIAINLNRFVDVEGDTVTPTTYPLGYANIPRSMNDLGFQLLEGVATVIDMAYLIENPDPSLPRPLPLAPDFFEKWLGHELGHALSLNHLQDGVNLMDPNPSRAITINESQRQIIHTQASLIPDRILASAPPLAGGTWPDNIQDILPGEEFVDLEVTGFVVDPNQDVTHLVASTLGLFPENGTGIFYYFAADLDNDPTTGGSPVEVGAPETSPGMELVGLVQVDIAAGIPQAAPTVWVYQSGQFVQSTHPGIQASVNTVESLPAAAHQVDDDFPVPDGQIIQLIIPNEVRGPVATEIRLMTQTKNISTGTVDQVEGPISLTPTALPSCQVTPDGALLGSSITVTANNLPALQDVQVFLGSTQVSSSTTDTNGGISTTFTIPVESRTGTQMVYVSLVGSGVDATCLLQLWSVPSFDVPPSPQDGSHFIITAGETLEFTIQASDADIETGDTVTLGVIDLPAGANLSIPAPANPAVSTFAWTPASDQIGSYVVVFTAHDSFGLSGLPLSVTITVQAESTLIFADGFESGDLSAWSSSLTDGGDLSVTAQAALSESYGMQAHIDDNNDVYVQDDSPELESQYYAAFQFDPNSVSIADTKSHAIFTLNQAGLPPIVKVAFGWFNGAYGLQAGAWDELYGGYRVSPMVTLSDAGHQIDIFWQAASVDGANDGRFVFWVDGQEYANLTTLDNETLSADYVRLGAVSGLDADTGGITYFDTFESRRQTPDGMLQAGWFAPESSAFQMPLNVEMEVMEDFLEH
jgi:hypothetical protein